MCQLRARYVTRHPAKPVLTPVVRRILRQWYLMLAPSNSKVVMLFRNDYDAPQKHTLLPGITTNFVLAYSRDGVH